MAYKTAATGLKAVKPTVYPILQRNQYPDVVELFELSANRGW